MPITSQCLELVESPVVTKSPVSMKKGKDKPKIDKDVLSPNEEKELAELEKKITVTENLICSKQLEMAKALKIIQDKKLYRIHYSTFRAYCEGRWDKSAEWGYKLVQHLNVCQVLADHDLEPATMKESALLAPLLKNEKDKLVKVFEQVNKKADKKGLPRSFAELEKEVFAIRGIAKDNKSKGVSAFRGKNYDGENMTAAEFQLALDFVQQFGGDWARAIFVLQQAHAQAELQAAEGVVS